MNDFYFQASIWFIAALAAAIITIATAGSLLNAVIYAAFFIAVFYVFCVRDPG